MDNLVIGGQRGVERILVAFRGGVLQSGQNAADVARPRCAEERYGSAGYRVLRNAAGIFEAAGLGDGGTKPMRAAGRATGRRLRKRRKRPQGRRERRAASGAKTVATLRFSPKETPADAT
jgi:hypothetical protein